MAESKRTSGLGRDFNSLSGDNRPTEKKPLVKRLGAYEGPSRPAIMRPPAPEEPGTGGRVVVIRKDKLPEKPNNASRRAGKGTCMLLRTERPREQRRYSPAVSLTAKEKYDIRPGKPIVINPRKKT